MVTWELALVNTVQSLENKFFCLTSFDLGIDPKTMLFSSSEEKIIANINLSVLEKWQLCKCWLQAPGRRSGTMVTVVSVACQLSGEGGRAFPESEVSVLSPCKWWTTEGKAGTSAACGKARPSRDKNLTQSCHPQVKRIALRSRALGDDCP